MYFKICSYFSQMLKKCGCFFKQRNWSLCRHEVFHVLLQASIVYILIFSPQFLFPCTRWAHSVEILAFWTACKYILLFLLRPVVWQDILFIKTFCWICTSWFMLASFSSAAFYALLEGLTLKIVYTNYCELFCFVLFFSLCGKIVDFCVL